MQPGPLRTRQAFQRRFTLHALTNRKVIVARAPEAKRSHPDDMLDVYIKGADGSMISLAELGHLDWGVREQTIYHKDLLPVA